LQQELGEEETEVDPEERTRKSIYVISSAEELKES
jgi:hypothetical protein